MAKKKVKPSVKGKMQVKQRKNDRAAKQLLRRSLDEPPKDKMVRKPEKKKEIWELIQFEEEIKESFLRGEIRTPVHLAGGNEEQLIGLFQDIKEGDWVFSTYRSHYHALLKGIPKEQVKRDILEGKSMHINSREHKFFTSSIVGGCLPIAVGVAMAIKRQGLSDWVWVFVGDMAAQTGMFHECYKYSAWHNLPIGFIIEDNGLSVNTPTKEAWGFGVTYTNERLALVGRKLITYERTYPHQGVGKWVVFA